MEFSFCDKNYNPVLSVSLDNANNKSCDPLPSTVTIIESTTTAQTTTPELTEPWEINYRLPNDTFPLHYDIYLYPNLAEATFDGSVKIHLHVLKSRTFLLVHTKFLDIISTKLHEETNGDEISIIENFEYIPNEFWVVKLKSEISPGFYILTMQFKGSLIKDVVGLFKTDYTNYDTNTTRYSIQCIKNNLNVA